MDGKSEAGIVAGRKSTGGPADEGGAGNPCQGASPVSGGLKTQGIGRLACALG